MAIRLLSDNECRGVHSLDTMIDNHSVKDILLEKHPSAQPLHLSTLVSSSSPNVFHSVLCDYITPELVKSFMLKINGSAGPSGLDAVAWKRLCTSFQSAGCDQLCAGLPGGCEAAVHSVRHLFESVDCEAVFLADARNAFNSLNRRAALLNIHSLCPSLAPILTNCYRLDIPFFIDGDVIFSS